MLRLAIIVTVLCVISDVSNNSLSCGMLNQLLISVTLSKCTLHTCFLNVFQLKTAISQYYHALIFTSDSYHLQIAVLSCYIYNLHNSFNNNNNNGL